MVSSLPHPIDGAFDWLIGSLELFHPFRKGCEPETHRSKAMTELAMICMCYYRTCGNEEDQRVQQFLSFISHIWQRPDYREEVIRPIGKSFSALSINSILKPSKISLSVH